MQPISSVLFDGDKIEDIIEVDDMSENSDKEKMSITELQKKGRRKIKNNPEKKVIEIDGFLDQISKDLKSCCWQNQGNQVPFQLLFDKFPIKISDLPTEVPKGNKTNKSYLVQVGTSRFLISCLGPKKQSFGSKINIPTRGKYLSFVNTYNE